MAEDIIISLRHDLLREAEIWRKKVAAWLGPDARLIHVSSHSSDVRVYQTGDRVLKARRLTPATVVNRPNALEDEFRLLRQLADSQQTFLNIPKAERYLYEPEWEALEMTATEPPVIFDPVVFRSRETWESIWALTKIIWRLNMLGFSHGDLTPANAGLNLKGEMILLDFDQAISTHPVRCVLRDFLGIPSTGKPSQYAIWDRLCKLRPFSVFGALKSEIYCCLRMVWKRPNADNENPLLARDVTRRDIELQELASYWHEAAIAGANSPGASIAYYSFDLRGFHFRGERPWVLRWEMLSGTVSFRGKTIVELGCNMGLLAINVHFAGASSVIAVDHSRSILDVATKVARLLGAPVDFRLVDFDRDENWETTLGDGDLVSALSLTYWLSDKDRLWRYLARFPEVIFEGHEPSDEIEERFSSLGYSYTRLGISERARIVFHATRNA